MDKTAFVQNIKDRCEKMGVRPTVACRESGVGTSFITDLNKGTTPSVAKVEMLARYFGCTVSDLLGEEPTKITQAADPKADDLCQEFARLFTSLSPENQNKVIAEMLKRKREQ
nr:MAG TPA: helix-turn-helix domain protein [Caudoviricetes sp.]